MTAELFRDPATGDLFARFSIDRPDIGGEISVVGSFNDWTPGVDVVRQQPDGIRRVEVRIDQPGDVHFRYLAAGGFWFDDPDSDAVDEHGSVLFRDNAPEPPPPRKRANPGPRHSRDRTRKETSR